MSRALALVARWALIALCAAGCYRGSAHAVTLSEVSAEPGWMLVSGVRLFRQESEHDCGVAALAMVLDRWGFPDAEMTVRKNLPDTSQHGVPAGRLRDFARASGFHSYLISGASTDLANEVRANRPVLVGLVQRYMGSKALAHYEVVVGLNQPRGRVLLFDPGHGPREDDLASFDQEWRDAGRLTLIVSSSSS